MKFLIIFPIAFFFLVAWLGITDSTARWVVRAKCFLDMHGEPEDVHDEGGKAHGTCPHCGCKLKAVLRTAGMTLMYMQYIDWIRK